jgi:hypothetical protein
VNANCVTLTTFWSNVKEQNSVKNPDLGPNKSYLHPSTLIKNHFIIISPHNLVYELILLWNTKSNTITWWFVQLCWIFNKILNFETCRTRCWRLSCVHMRQSNVANLINFSDSQSFNSSTHWKCGNLQEDCHFKLRKYYFLVGHCLISVEVCSTHIFLPLFIPWLLV